MSLFDAYVMVDWSAAKGPKRGRDSIWIGAEMRPTFQGIHRAALPGNPPTRADAVADLSALLADLSAAGARVLVGFDFAFGYPQGTAAALGLAGIPWRAMWVLLADLVDRECAPDFDRFALAGTLNRRLSGAAFPFWGHPTARHYAFLRPTRPDGYGVRGPADRRAADRAVPQAKSVWQLFYNGSVGSQVLLGLPWLVALLEDERLAGRCRVWPFETGLAAPDLRAGEVLFAEIYPSLIRVSPAADEIKDRLQVETVVRTLRYLDDRGRLAGLFQGDPGLSQSIRSQIEMEEAWILGVGADGANLLGPAARELARCQAHGGRGE